MLALSSIFQSEQARVSVAPASKPSKSAVPASGLAVVTWPELPCPPPPAWPTCVTMNSIRPKKQASSMKRRISQRLRMRGVVGKFT